jgi:hypothetical protein
MFIPGLELCRRFYDDVVVTYLADVPHTAARIGPGSEVLGFDTERSTDHDWGPRLQVFLRPVDMRGPEISAALSEGLGTPTQAVAEFTGGAVFHDGLGELSPARDRLAWYPDDIWRYILACQWQRLSLLMHRRYPPYSKWLGAAFARLPLAGKVTPMLISTLAATTWHEREDHLATAYTAIAKAHNNLGLTEAIDSSTRPYHDRPFQVLHAERFTHALLDTIPHLKDLPLTGAIDQFADNTNLLGDRDLTSSLVEITQSGIRL